MIEYKVAGKNDIDKRYNRLRKGAGIQRLFFKNTIVVNCIFYRKDRTYKSMINIKIYIDNL